MVLCKSPVINRIQKQCDYNDLWEEEITLESIQSFMSLSVPGKALGHTNVMCHTIWKTESSKFSRQHTYEYSVMYFLHKYYSP